MVSSYCWTSLDPSPSKCLRFSWSKHWSSHLKGNFEKLLIGFPCWSEKLPVFEIVWWPSKTMLWFHHLAQCDIDPAFLLSPPTVFAPSSLWPCYLTCSHRYFFPSSYYHLTPLPLAHSGLVILMHNYRPLTLSSFICKKSQTFKL